MERKKLLKTAAFLRKLPRKQFNICVWHEKYNCGTVACVIGWIPSIFPRANFEVREGGGSPIYTDSKRQYYYGVYAGAQFFKIDKFDAYSLFMPNGYPNYGENVTPKQVAKRIENYVKTGKL